MTMTYAEPQNPGETLKAAVMVAKLRPIDPLRL